MTTTVTTVQMEPKELQAITGLHVGELLPQWGALSKSPSAPPCLWAIHRPQKAVVQLSRAGAFNNKSVLDLGCGLGDNALCLQQLCHSRVTAVDNSGTALEFAIAKEHLRLDRMTGRVSWLQVDLLNPQQVASAFGNKQFDVLLDCGLFHSLNMLERRVFLNNVTPLCKPGGLLYLLAFSDKCTCLQKGWPRALSLPGIHACFNAASGWEVQEVLETALEHHLSIHAASDHTQLPTDSKAFERVWRGHVESYLIVARRLPEHPSTVPRYSHCGAGAAAQEEQQRRQQQQQQEYRSAPLFKIPPELALAKDLSADPNPVLACGCIEIAAV